MFMSPVSLDTKSDAITPVAKASHKKKKTYTIRIQGALTTPYMFSSCTKVPLPVCSIDGAPIHGTYKGCGDIIEFPGAHACTLVKNYNSLTPHINERLARTIIEYYDKVTGAPVVQLYPEQVYVFDGYGADYLQHLNHASRADFLYQLKLRKHARKQMLHSLQH